MTSLAPGARLGGYEIRGRIGAGGMGEVWRATDTRLDRVVALKLLPPDFAHDADRVARFTREAKALATLQHPSIASVYGFEEVGGRSVLAMELVDGEGLDERMAKGPIAVDEAIPIARQIAEALEAAHEKGIVHRDLKPANVKLTTDGRVKLLDFGLAKALAGEAPESSGPELTQSPTLTARATQAGVILGTAAYMAPEQARGKPVDKRADIWALGVVLFEMLTGKRLFGGETVSDTLAAVLRQEVDWSALPAETPPRVREVLRRALARDPKQRLHDAGDARLELEEAGGPAVSVPAAPARRAAALPWALTLLFAGAALAALLAARRAPEAPMPRLRAQLALPPGVALEPFDTSLALSPDGTRLAITASSSDGRNRLWLRSLDSLSVQALDGTEGASSPFWSPDGRALGFFADRKLKRIAIPGGTPQTICDAADGRGASWGSSGTIVFAPAPFGGLWRVPASGGTPVEVTKAETKDTSHRMPCFLPDGRRVLFTDGIDVDRGFVAMIDLKTRKVSPVLKQSTSATYVEPGYLVFLRGSTLMAQRVSPGDLTPRAEAVPIAENVWSVANRWTGGYAISANGLLVYEGGSLFPKSRLTWFDLDGKQLGALEAPDTFGQVALGPGGRIGVAQIAKTVTQSALYLYDLVSGTASRFTFGVSAFSPAISADGKRVYYSDDNGAVFVKDANGLTDARPVAGGDVMNRVVTGVSPDGSVVAVSVQQGASFDVCLLPQTGDRKMRPFIATPANEVGASFSADGKWLAYSSDESGRPEAYAVAYPAGSPKLQLSSNGITDAPFWVAPSELAFWHERKLYGVTLPKAGEEIAASAPRVLLGGREVRHFGAAAPGDGKRVLLVVPVDDGSSPPLTLVTSWMAALPR